MAGDEVPQPIDLALEDVPLGRLQQAVDCPPTLLIRRSGGIRIVG
jgi:hypothetical protein